jgi:Helicase HerA, central domain
MNKQTPLPLTKETAFLATDFNWVRSQQSIWSNPPTDVGTLNQDQIEGILRDFSRLDDPNADSAIGRVVNGPAGSGKTHILGTLRRRVWEKHGWFVLLDIVGIKDFWRTACLGFIRSLRQPLPDGRAQYQAVFEAALERVPARKRKAVVSANKDLGTGATAAVNLFVRILQSEYPAALEHSNIIRALLLQGDPDVMEIAYNWLQGLDVDPADRSKLNLTAPPPTNEDLVRGISWLMSIGGPTLIAIDQIDSIVAASNLAADTQSNDEAETTARNIIHLFGDGLINLKGITTRSMTVISCLGETWTILRNKVLHAAIQRFSEPVFLRPAETGQISDLIANRLRPGYAKLNGALPYPTWPFSSQAIAKVGDVLPRNALMLCENFRLKCLSDGKVTECLRFDGVSTIPPPPPDTERSLDAKFASLKAAADLEAVYSDADDGNRRGELISEVLELYKAEVPAQESIDVEVTDYSDERRPALHSRLTFTFHSEGDLEKHYCFRIIEHPHSLSVQARLRAAMTASGIDKKLPFRHLFILRNADFPSGRVTNELRTKFLADGGKCIAMTDDDLRTFIGLRDLWASKPDGFLAWLQATKPLCKTSFFQSVGLCPPPLSASVSADARKDGETTKPSSSVAQTRISPIPMSPETQSAKPAATTPKDAVIPLGCRLEGGSEGRPETLPADLLTRHTAIFAGSGSGKTVLLRRIVEEAALLGIPAIVLDTNNDLARLGEVWPARPTALSDDDAQRAQRYKQMVEVVVWTPGLAGGRALNLAVLPDFTAIADDEERDQAVDMAWATLVPLIRATGSAKDLKEGLLKDSLRAFARQGKGGIHEFISFLADLPEGVSKLTKAQKLGADMSDQLIAKIAINPLLSAPDQKLDPATLFIAQKSGKTRISVINFSGLHADASRQDFVNQLQMALFTFIRKYPSETPRLYVLDEAQNFAPSTASTPSKASAKALAAQARKFGLGMIFATQAPKGIDTNIVSNCTTHFYGRMSSPELIDSTKEMMAARGKPAQDLGALTTGIFYYSTLGMSQPVKLKTPLCLTYHPQNPATVDEILNLSRV